MAQIGPREAASQLEHLVERAQAGEEIVIERDGKAVARLIPVKPSFAELRGAWEGRVHIADDFDELPGDIADTFGAR